LKQCKSKNYESIHKLNNYPNESSTKANELKYCESFKTSAHKKLETRIKLLEDTIEALNWFIKFKLRQSFNLDNRNRSVQLSFLLSSNFDSTDKKNNQKCGSYQGQNLKILQWGGQ
jgi:hypothetical protein